MQAPQKIAFVSGKGGVGKTLLAANFALFASTRRRTVLIDIDFQNQGSSGLLADYVRPGCVNAFDLLVGQPFDARALIEVRNGLFLIPSFDPSKTDRFGSQLGAGLGNFGLIRLHRVLQPVLTTGPFDLLVLDCHGGLDDVSFAAFIYSDMTFIVTEADKVTFNGTLELLDFYIGRAEFARRASQTEVATAAAEDELFRRVARVENNKVRFLVNRVSGKFSYEGLTRTLEHQFYANFTVLQAMNEGFFFFPSDPLAAESFSEYPFFVEIIPESIFAQILELLYADTFYEEPVVRGRSRFFRAFERMSLDRLKRYLKSPYDVRVQSVFTFVAVSQTVVAFYVMIYPLLSDRKLMGGIAFLLGVAFFLYLALFDFKVSGFFRDRLRYEIRLYRKGARRLTAPFVVRLTRVFLFRVFPMFGAFFFLLVAFFLVVASLRLSLPT